MSLTIGEVWAVGSMLRLALVERLHELAAPVGAARRDRTRAHELSARLDRALGYPAHRDARLLRVQLPDGPLSAAFIIELLQWGPARTRRPRWRRSGPGSAIDSIDTAALRRSSGESQREAAAQLAISNVIGSMRLLSALDWPAFFERVSRVGARCAARSGGAYPQMDFATRDRYPAVGRRAGPAIRAGRDCDRGTRVRACGRCGDLQPRSRSNAPCRLLPDLAWPFSDRARDRLSTAPRSTAGALCVPASGRGLPRKRRAADDAAGREPGDLRRAPWSALAAARAGRTTGRHPDQRAGAQPDQPVRHLSDPPAPGAETGLPTRDPCRGPHAGRRAHSLRISRARGRDFRAARSARARQQRRQPALRGARRLP